MTSAGGGPGRRPDRRRGGTRTACQRACPARLGTRPPPASTAALQGGRGGPATTTSAACAGVQLVWRLDAAVRVLGRPVSVASAVAARGQSTHSGGVLEVRACAYRRHSSVVQERPVRFCVSEGAPRDGVAARASPVHSRRSGGGGCVSHPCLQALLGGVVCYPIRVWGLLGQGYTAGAAGAVARCGGGGGASPPYRHLHGWDRAGAASAILPGHRRRPGRERPLGWWDDACRLVAGTPRRWPAFPGATCIGRGGRARVGCAARPGCWRTVAVSARWWRLSHEPLARLVPPPLLPRTALVVAFCPCPRRTGGCFRYLLPPLVWLPFRIPPTTGLSVARPFPSHHECLNRPADAGATALPAPPLPLGPPHHLYLRDHRL